MENEASGETSALLHKFKQKSDSRSARLNFLKPQSEVRVLHDGRESFR